MALVSATQSTDKVPAVDIQKNGVKRSKQKLKDRRNYMNTVRIKNNVSVLKETKQKQRQN